MALLIVVTSVLSAIWVQVVGSGVLGSLRPWFASYGFNLCTVLVLYFVPKPGSALVVRSVSGIVEIFLGNPFGLLTIYYRTVEGLGFGLAFWLRRRTLSLFMIFLGAVLALILAVPLDAWIERAPLNSEAFLAYFGREFVGRISSSILVYLSVLGIRRAGFKPRARLIPERSVRSN